MTEVLVAAVVLGAAGIDPAGFAIALGALAAGVRERAVVGFTLIAVAGTALLGVVLSLTVGRQLQEFDWASLLPPDWLAAVVELAVAVALLGWAIARTRRRGARPPRPTKGRRSGMALLWVGVLFALSAAADPTFVGLVVLAGRSESPLAVVLAHLVWILVSQIMLVLLAGAVVARRHEGLVARMQSLMTRARPGLATAATVTLVVAGSLLALDSFWWFAGGSFLIADPG